ncbi:MAG TPA: TetR/AcrR family transcriptional regulator [Acetivibrio clariflavus]|nr:TetR/AcrR family transcriptional regulator [Acetivibrio clariflavus]HPU41291.1 TetR/AcrR family transcriptional regulator [Acetivibrio clariflavus]
MGSKSEKISQSQKILQTAYQCLSTRGYANVSMRDIADEAGVALSQLNYYYKNKEGLFTEVVKMMMNQYLHEVEDELKSTPNAKERIASLVTYFKELIRKKPELLRLFIDFTAQSLWLPSFRRHLKNLFADLSEMIKKSILAGTVINKNLRGHSPKSLARLVLGALYGTSIQIMLDSDEDTAFDSLNLIGMILG